MKLVSQMGDNMRTLSSMWAPPIYRRLLSLDKKERDMSISCLRKAKSCIFPPLPSLSKVNIIGSIPKLQSVLTIILFLHYNQVSFSIIGDLPLLNLFYRLLVTCLFIVNRSGL